MSFGRRLCVALMFAVVAGGCSSTNDAIEIAPSESATPAPSDEGGKAIPIEPNDRLRSWGVDRIVVAPGKLGATAQFVNVAGDVLATIDLTFDGPRSVGRIKSKHGDILLDLVGSEERFSMTIVEGERTWSATKEATLGDKKLYEKVSTLGFLDAFSDLIMALGPGSGAQPQAYDAALWGEHLAAGCWSFPDGAALNCAASLPALALDLATINWTWGLCSPLCYGAGLAPPSAIGCFACIGANLAVVGISWQLWSSVYPEQCRRACLNGCFGDFPPMPDYMCGRAGRHEAPPPGMNCADGLVKCCGTYCEYPTMCSTQSASQGAPAALGGTCGTLNVVKEGVAYPTCTTVACAQGWCDDPDRDGVGTCVDTQPQPPSSTWKLDPAQPVLSKSVAFGEGGGVTVNCSNPTPFGDQCRGSSLRNVKTTYSRCWACDYWTCGDLWDANKQVPEKNWCDMLASNCVAATVHSCALNNICGGMGQACCNTGGGNKCDGNQSCTDIGGQQKCDE